MAGYTPGRDFPRRRRAAGSLIVLIVLAMVGLWLYADHTLHRVDAIGDYPSRPAAGAVTNWLIVGSDSRQGLSSTQANQLHTATDQAVSGSRTDTIMLVHGPATTPSRPSSACSVTRT